MHVGSARSRLAVLVGIVVLVALLVTPMARAHDSDNHQEDHIRVPGKWNGFRIYLSPAHHWNGEKHGCGDYVEDDNMHGVAHRATTDPSGLLARGYKVRIGHGDPDDNTDRSNAWRSHRHVALHSNASEDAPCTGTEGGTVGFHYPGSAVGEALAAKLMNKVGVEPVSGSPFSPGTRSERVDTAEWWELAQTNMPAAYLETEFHDWVVGAIWLADYESWAWRIAWAIDAHLGYPRPCGQCLRRGGAGPS